MKTGGRPAIALAIAVLATSAPAGAKDIDLEGIWSGKVEAGVSHGIQGHEPHVSEPTFGNYELTFTLEILEQEGRALIGTWSSADHSERIFGVLRRNDTDIIMVDEDSHFDGRLLSASSMELCLAETHDDAIAAWCLLMEKQ